MKQVDTKSNILEAATNLFSSKGFDGVSLRDVSEASNANLNSIRHHFGTKLDLLIGVFEQYDLSVFDAPVRIIEGGATSKEEFRTKLGLFLNEILTQMLLNRKVFRILFREGHRSKKKPRYAPQQEGIIRYLKQSQKNGIVSKKIKPEMISGVFMDRLIPQVMYTEHLKEFYGTDIDNPKFRKKWIDSTLDLFLDGLLTRS